MEKKRERNKIALDTKYLRFYRFQFELDLGLDQDQNQNTDPNRLYCGSGRQFPALGHSGFAREDHMAAKLPKQDLEPRASTVHTNLYLYLVLTRAYQDF